MTDSEYPGSRLALISVSDKSGIVEFARQLVSMGFSLLSTGGTAGLLREAGLKVTGVADFTGSPEIMGGRVKTLHPRIHGGLLGRAGLDEAVMRDEDISRIDLLVLNLYPFEEVTRDPGCDLETAIENIDIGGPAMLRSAAKNFESVAVVTDPDQYDEVLEKLAAGGGSLDRDFRFNLSVAAFNRVAQYDGAISHWLSAHNGKTGDQGRLDDFPGQTNGTFIKVMDLRYGENPHQKGAWYRDLYPAPGSLSDATQHQGKALSFNNINDADAAWQCIGPFESPACVIVKHANPCGVAIAGSVDEAYDLAFQTDPTSAFGGIIAFNRVVDEPLAGEIIERQFLEMLIAPEFTDAALERLKSKKNIRVLEALVGQQPTHHDTKRVASGLLIQSADSALVTQSDCRVVSKRKPTDEEWSDLLFAWKAAKFVKSNAIVYASGGRTLGIGAGQMSRVDSARIARWKAEDAGLNLNGSVMASDAFFPFRDGIDTAAGAGIAAVIQPGGSMRDDEVVAAADENNMAMVFTGIRHFRH
jgi:phosphoribosylaminoimidazolecarboxamide formyltransferase/IMP cyclohydrolase